MYTTGDFPPSFFFNIIFINWSLVSLQCCAILCSTAKCISYMYTYSSSLSPRNIETQVWKTNILPACQLCFSVGSHSLSITYIVVYIYVNTNLLIHPSTPQFSWYLYICLYFCFANKFISTIFLHSTYIC